MITGRVYFVQAGESGPIKIGYARNVKRRLSSLQTAHPERLRLVAEGPGSKGHERAFHEGLKNFRISGEWFAPNDVVLRAAKILQLYALCHGEDTPDEIEEYGRECVAEHSNSDDETLRLWARRIQEYLST